MKTQTQRVFALVLLLGVIALSNYFSGNEGRPNQANSDLSRISSK